MSREQEHDVARRAVDRIVSGAFGHHLMMVAALGGRDCAAKGTLYGEYENAVADRPGWVRHRHLRARVRAGANGSRRAARLDEGWQAMRTGAEAGAEHGAVVMTDGAVTVPVASDALALVYRARGWRGDTAFSGVMPSLSVRSPDGWHLALHQHTAPVNR